MMNTSPCIDETQPSFNTILSIAVLTISVCAPTLHFLIPLSFTLRHTQAQVLIVSFYVITICLSFDPVVLLNEYLTLCKLYVL